MTTAPQLTNHGIEMLTRSAGGETIAFSRFKIGNGAAPASVDDMDDLVNPLVSFDVNAIDKSHSGYVKITGSFDNTSISESFRWRELGIFCEGETSEEFTGDGSDEFTLSSVPTQINKVKVNGIIAAVSSYDSESGTVTLSTAPDIGDEVEIFYPDGEEVLFAYANDGDNAGMLKADLTDVVAEQSVTVVVAVSNAANITIILNQSAVYITKEEFEAHTNAPNPHNITKDTVGLGNVPNKSTNDQTPTFTTASTFENIASGEKLTTIFGKIKRALQDVVAHFNNFSNPHRVTAAQAGAAKTEHTHSVADFTSGVLSIDRGGTGASTLEGLRSSVFSAIGVYTMDANTATSPGIRELSAGSPNLPLPNSGEAGLLLVLRNYGGNYVSQFCLRSDSDNTPRLFFRHFYVNTTSVPTWKEIGGNNG